MVSDILEFFNANPTEIINPLFGFYYWIGFLFSALVISSLFIFKKFFAKLSQHNSFRYSLGFFQLVMFFSFYIVHGISGGYYWYDYFPFQLCSVLNITSAILLLLPLEGIFNITLPLIGPVILAFLFPDSTKWVFGPQHFLYYNYYFTHAIIMFSYLYLYLYGHVLYNKKYIKKSVLSLVLFGAVVFIFNLLFGTDYLFIGKEGYLVNVGKTTFDTGIWAPILRFCFMFSIGITLLTLTYYFINKFLVPFYFERGTKINEKYKNKKNIFQKIRLKLAQKQNIKLGENNDGVSEL